MNKLLAIIVAVIVGVTITTAQGPRHREPEKMNTACTQMCPGHRNANG